MPVDLNAAFLVVLHIPAHSRSFLDQVLAQTTSMPVSSATDRQRLKPGHVYVAPADLHLTVGEGVVRLTRGPKECRARPSVDVLLRSAAVSYGTRAIGVVLSGMLDDGTAGLWAIKDQHGLAMVQDPAEAMHPSMPQSALAHVAADFVGTVSALAGQIARVTAGPAAVHQKPDSSLHHTETRIATSGNALQLGVMKMGQVSKYTCPDCHGVLVQIEEGSIVRFRCHTGHAFSLQTLLAEVSESIDNGLWDAVRAIEERVLLLRQIADLAQRQGRAEAALGYRQLADETENRIKVVRDLVLDERLFGRQA